MVINDTFGPLYGKTIVLTCLYELTPEFSAWGAAVDLLLALYPVLIVSKLRMRLKLKVVLGILMGLGVFTAVCSLAKTIEFDRMNQPSTNPDSTCK